MLASIITVALAALACTIAVGGPDYPETPIPIATESTSSVEDMVHAAETAAAESGTLTLTFNESQLTTLLATKLAAQSEPLLTEPQVYLRDNQIQIYGKATRANLQANVRIVLAASVSPEGQPVINVTSADFGPFPAPEGLNKTISAFMQEAFTGALGPAAIGFRLESITIADGVLTLTGRVK